MEVNNHREDHQNGGPSDWFIKYLNHQGDWLEKTRGNLMVAATVIASMSFQVMVNPPGGVWQSNGCSSGDQTAPVCKGKAGTAVLEYEKRVAYIGMVISCTVSFSASMSLILLVISGLRLRGRVIMAFLITFMLAAVLCMSAAFLFAIALVQSDDNTIRSILYIYVAFWIVFPVLILVIQIIRFLYWLICLLCCCCPRRRRRPTRSPLPPSPVVNSEAVPVARTHV